MKASPSQNQATSDTGANQAKHHTNMSTLASLRSNLCNTIHTIEILLGTMAPPVQNLTQEFEYDGYIKRINEMTLKANANFLDIEADHGTTSKPQSLMLSGPP